MKLINKLFLLIYFVIISGLSSAQVSFTPSNLNGVTIGNPTSLQFGPDGRLYVSERMGIIKAYTIVKDSTNSYTVSSVEIIDKIKFDIKNHNDDGTLATNLQKRQVTGFFVTGTSTNPIIFVSSSDPRDNYGSVDTGLDTNSGIISRLTWNGSSWEHVDLVRGIARSEENHSINGLLVDSVTNMLYVCVGGNTNMGSPSINFALTPEYATSAAILSVDLNAIYAMPVLTDSTGVMPDYIYDLPTLDDEDRAGPVDFNDPFGGNNGKNQAMLVAGGPVQIFSSGLRNPYDLVKTEAGNFFTFDNGPNRDWGGIPPIDSVTGKCINVHNDTINSFTHCDQLHHIPGAGFYAGFSNPTRSNRENTFNDTIFYNGGLDTILPQTPIPPGMEDASCEYRVSPKSNWCTQFTITNYPDDGALAVNYRSSNGMCEYTASNFNGALQGDLLVSDLGGVISHYDLDSTGINLDLNSPNNGQNILLQNFGSWSLDVIAQGDNDIFPGTIWVCNFLSNSITVFDPDDLVNCDTTDLNADADNDGYSNGDEMANGSNPCSAGDQPSDFDGDNLSDLWDGDDDNDGINDTLDFFAQDSTNGILITLPVSYAFTNANDGGIQDWGLTGLMTDSRDYMDKYDLAYMTVGGAALKFTIDSITSGTATGSGNNNDYAFQFGINVANENDNFTVKSRAMSPFSGITGGNLVDQSIGMFVGTGDQDNYLKVVCHANSGSGGILVEKEELGVTSSTMYSEPILGNSFVDLFLIINPNNNTAQPAYSINGGNQTNIGSPISIPASWTDTVLATGFIAGAGPSSPVTFAATWDFIEAYQGPLTNPGNWYNVPTNNTPSARHENAFVEACGKFYLIGGRGIKPVQEFNPLDSTWTNKSATPIQMHHFQAVELDGLIYVVGAFTDGFPNENPIPNVYIYDPLSDTWTVGKEIPSSRRRGSAGAVVHEDKIYVIGGIVNGHLSNTVDWFDVYDPYANTWDSLPSAPRIRDHFQASIANDKMVVAGGRITSGAWPTVAEVDIFNFTINSWSTLPSPSGDIPTQRGGCCAVTIGDEVVIIGGESTAQSVAFNETEALDVNTLTWRTLDTLNIGRHGTQAAVSNGGIYVCAGSGNAGGSPELNSLEAFYFNSITQPDTNGTAESILVSAPSNINYGQTVINSTQSSVINITNTTGNQATIINSLSIIGDSEFTVDSTFGTPDVPFVLAPGQNINIKVNYYPVATGIHTAMLNVGTTGASSPYNVSLSGEGIDTLTSLYRINSGGGSYTANNGQLFVADNYFVNGVQFAPGYLDTVDILNTLDDELYRSERNGTLFSYDFPVSNGGYEIKLHFAEIYWDAPNGGAGGVGSRVFDVNIEGNSVLANYDIFVAAGGAITPVIETFVVNVTDGELNIDFTSIVDNAKVSAIEVQGTSLALTYWYHDNDSDSYGNPNIFLQDSIQPAGYVADSTDCNDNVSAINPGAIELLDGLDNDCDGMIDEDFIFDTYRVNSGGINYNTTGGKLFSADQYFNPSPGSTISTSNTISATADDSLFQTARVGIFGYNFPIIDGIYAVNLHFAEIDSAVTTAGNRVFNIDLEGVTIETDFDILAAEPIESAVINSYNVIITDDTLNLNFYLGGGGAYEALISAIEIVPLDSADYTWYQDFDNDGFGNASSSIIALTQPIGYLTDSTDCDDTNNLVYPGAIELPDSLDNDCDGMIDENISSDLRINSGGPDYLSTASDLFLADNYFVGGVAFTNIALDTVDILNTVEDELYRSERTGVSFSYVFPVLDTSFLIKLHFADIYWGATNGGGSGVPGERVFDVIIEGDTVLKDFDIIAEIGGPETAFVRDFNIYSTDGNVNIDFIASVDQAKISAIEIIPDSTGTSCTLALTDSVINVSCNGLSDGAAYISVTGNQSSVSYLWSNGTTNSSTNNLNAGIYSVTVSESASCSSVLSLTINEPAPVEDSIYTNDPTTFCAGVGAVLEAPSVPGYAYQWTRFNNPLNGDTLSTVLAKQNGSYRCIITDMNGCSAISNKIITTKLDRAIAAINEVGPVEFCGLQSTTLSAQTYAGYTYLWLRYGKLAPGQNTDSLYTTAKGGNYKVRVTAPNGCTATSEKTIAIKNPIPNAVVDQAGPIAACYGDSITLNAFSNRGTPPFTAYQWFRYNTTLTNDTNPSITVLNTGGYSVRMTDSKGCADKSTRTVVNFSNCSFNCNIPTITSIANLSATGADLGWSTASTAPEFEIRYAVSGSGSFTYDTVGTVYMYNITGLTPSTTYETAVRALCNPPSAWSGSITFTTNALKFSSSGLSNTNLAVTAYPNPTNGSINLIIESPVNNKGSIIIRDLTGRVVRNSNTEFYGGNNYLEFDLSDLKPGLYFINVNINGYSERIKIVKN